jgi:hypothetical protein
MMKSKQNASPVKLVNPRTGDIWLCEDYNARRLIDGAQFVEVYKPNTSRRVWMNLDQLNRAMKT